MRNTIFPAALAVAILGAASVAHAGNVSPAFDGEYFGQRELVTGLSDPACPNGTLHGLTIKDGAFRDEAGDIRGFVTSDGFFTGAYKVDGERQTFEGLVSDDQMVGGVIGPDEKCFWLVRLTKN